ncbi:hypothetical protein L9F63_019986 [Diploptera punctata]|uniref:MD-2-related lipid-recognition domain-containing protein n=1 Tax=Diploptera punctata TaxID=6984 RepID=A0AAD8EDZ6_DIPPU|nr:hypothetical protein L9F63_019986 [Diploptera punctata]
MASAQPKKGYLSLVVFIFVVSCATAEIVTFENCGSKSYPVSIDIHSCAEAPCIILNGTQENVTLTFLASYTSSSLADEANLRIKTAKVPVDVIPEPCGSGSSITCPMEASDTPYEFNSTLLIPTDAAPVDAYLELKLLDYIGEIMVCYRVGVRIFREYPS